MPPGLSPPADCYIHQPERSAACIDTEPRTARPTKAVTAVGTYQPLPYILAATTLRIGTDSRSAVRWGRVPGAAIGLLLLAAAVRVLKTSRADPRAYLGLVLSVTPMVLYCAASLTGSGLEITAAIAFVAAALRLTRDGRAPASAWLLLGVSGALLALSRSASPLWVALEICVVPALLGARGTMRAARSAPIAASTSVALLVVGVALNRVWETLYGPHVSLATKAIPLGARNGVGQWARSARELVGGFDYLEFPLPVWIPLLWLAATVSVLVLAWRASHSRARKTLAATAATVTVLPLAFYVAFTRATGFGLQGRHVLPLIVLLPLLGGELVLRNTRRLPAPVTGLVAASAGIVPFVAFWFNARRSAVGVDGGWWFFGDAQWAPPLGWTALMAATAAGCALVSLAVCRMSVCHESVAASGD